MRLNRYIALCSSLSRRAADAAIEDGRVTVDGTIAVKGTDIQDTSRVKLDGQILYLPTTTTTILFHKPVGVVCSRNGQGSRTVFDCLPGQYQSLQSVGRLDKDSSGLLLLTNDGMLANSLTHPSYMKAKRYEITLDKLLQPLHQQMIADHGIQLADGKSRLMVSRLEPSTDQPAYEVVMSEGRNRQIRRTFASLGYTVTSLHRTTFGRFDLGDLPPSHYRVIDP